MNHMMTLKSLRTQIIEGFFEQLLLFYPLYVHSFHVVYFGKSKLNNNNHASLKLCSIVLAQFLFSNAVSCTSVSISAVNVILEPE